MTQPKLPWSAEEQARAENLNKLLNKEFKGDRQALADALKLSKSTIDRYLKAGSDRPMGYSKARKLEERFGLPKNSFDRQHHNDKETYYLAIFTNALYSYEIVQALHSYDCVVECSAVLGDFDVFVKVQVESFVYLNLLLTKVVRLPGVKRCKTYTSAPDLRWQRAQSEHYSVSSYDEKMPYQTGLEQFLQKKITSHFNAIKHLERGEVVMNDDDDFKIPAADILQGAETCIYATRELGEKVSGQKRLHDAERALLKTQGVKSKRIVFLTQEDLRGSYFERVKHDHAIYKGMGCEIRFLFKNQWYKNAQQAPIERFLIIDDKFVSLRDEARQCTIFRREKEQVASYTDYFKTNWRKAILFERLKEIRLDKFGED